ncbi:SDR family oxidoreductase [Alphaproteobacteria bacterium KMM 3653]|uniref:SDR family oxidoreductase n=1 Tax=Harenicola maris TaxID=2841044 RepID=A0AAP2G988_9RHOB|nr:SDR family oxidoreductase [Harenicola maris]
MTLPKTPSFRLDGRRALVAGGSRGIGLGAAVALAEAGGEVVITARGEKGLTEATEAMRAEGHNVSGAVLDITDLEAQEAFLAAQAPFDVMVNSAGTARHAAALDMTAEDYDAVTNTNTRAAFFLARNVARGMAGTGGSIIMMSSQMGHVGGPDRSVYCATKHAVEGMTKSMAIEWGPQNIRVNTICPTFIRTPLTAPTFADPEKLAWIQSKIKLPRTGEISDIMGAVVFLATDASSLVTGTSILVDGGWTAG